MILSQADREQISEAVANVDRAIREAGFDFEGIDFNNRFDDFTACYDDMFAIHKAIQGFQQSLKSQKKGDDKPLALPEGLLEKLESTGCQGYHKTPFFEAHRTSLKTVITHQLSKLIALTR